MRKFDFYEFVGVLLPGVVLLTVVGLVFPSLKADIVGTDMSVGDFGWRTMLAYVVGHLLQGIGNLIERAYWWFWGGMPTDWIRSGKRPLIAGEQQRLLQHNVRKLLGNEAFELEKVNSHQWDSITRQVYAYVSDAGLSYRVDVFNGNYGLFRGVASALLVSLVLVLITDWTAWRAEFLIAVLGALAIYRMHRFGVRYGRELFVQFIQASARGKAK